FRAEDGIRDFPVTGVQPCALPIWHSDVRFGLLNTPTPAGPLTFATGDGPGWEGPRGWTCPHPATAPLPREWGRYKGLYLHGKRRSEERRVGEACRCGVAWR